MPEPLKLVYIGAGGFTNACMLPQLHAHGVQLAAICDLVAARAELAARRYGFARSYIDYRAMLDAEQPAAVICVGGPQVHYTVGRDVLDRGYPLYIQKSPAPTAAQTAELAALAAQRGVACHVGLNLRSSAAGLAARQRIEDPAFGPVTLVMVRYGLVSGATLRDAVYDQHCHAWDTLRWLGGEVETLQVLAQRVPGRRGYVGAVRFASGAVGSINFTSEQTQTKEFFAFEVTGTGGNHLLCHDFDLVDRRPDEPDRVLQAGNYSGPLGELTWLGYVADLASFLAAVRGEAADRAPVADSVATMRLCELAYEQLREQGAEA